MSDGLRDAYRIQVDTSPRSLAISEFFGHNWNPGRIGPLLTALYDAGALERISDCIYKIVSTGVIIDCNPTMANSSNDEYMGIDLTTINKDLITINKVQCNVCDDRGVVELKRSCQPCDGEDIILCKWCDAGKRVCYVAYRDDDVVDWDEDREDLLRRLTEEYGVDEVIGPSITVKWEAPPL